MNYLRGGGWCVSFSDEDMYIYLISVVEEEGDGDSRRRKCDVR